MSRLFIMQHIKIITLVFCLLCSCQNNAQKQDKFLHGNICLTDNIETCLAKGAIVSTGKSILNPTGFTLANNSFDGIIFNKSAVKFNNSIEYIKLSTQHGYNERKRGLKDNSESLFNQTLQRLCQLYSNMQEYTIDKTEEGRGYNINKKGLGYKWETANKRIKLEKYSGNVYKTSKNENKNTYGWSAGFSMAEIEYGGNFVELTFEKK